MARIKISYLCERCRANNTPACMDCDRSSHFIEGRRAIDVAYERYYKPQWKETRELLETLKNPFAIKKVHFNDPVTVVLWADGTKTIVKCQEGDVFDPEKGLAMAIAKKAMGNKGNYCEVFKKWLPEEKANLTDGEISFREALERIGKAAVKSAEAVSQYSKGVGDI